jgi:hypothetical protein
MSQSGVLVTIGAGRMPFTCNVCQGKLFTTREIKLNTSGAEFFDMGWANKSANGLVCCTCGYVHAFLAKLEYWKPENGYPNSTGWQ